MSRRDDGMRTAKSVIAELEIELEMDAVQGQLFTPEERVAAAQGSIRTLLRPYATLSAEELQERWIKQRRFSGK